MPTAVLCEQWSVPFPSQLTEQHWFLRWIQHSEGTIKRHVTAGHLAMAALADAELLKEPRVVEYFGGLGLQTRLIHELFKPREHWVYDDSTEAVQHLVNTVPEGVHVVCGDSLNIEVMPQADFVAFDSGVLTVHRMITDHAPVLHRVFMRRPQAVLLTDVAGVRFPVNKQHYAKIFGVPELDSYEHYVRCLVKFIQDKYEYDTLAAYHYKQGVVMSLVLETERKFVEPVPVDSLSLRVEL